MIIKLYVLYTLQSLIVIPQFCNNIYNTIMSVKIIYLLFLY